MITYYETTVAYTNNVAYIYTSSGSSSASYSFSTEVHIPYPPVNNSQTGAQTNTGSSFGTVTVSSNGATIQHSYSTFFLSVSGSGTQEEVTYLVSTTTGETSTVPSSSSSNSGFSFFYTSYESTNGLSFDSIKSTISFTTQQSSGGGENQTVFDYSTSFSIFIDLETSIKQITIDSDNTDIFQPFTSLSTIDITTSNTLTVIGSDTYFTTSITYTKKINTISTGSSYTSYENLIKNITVFSKLFMNKVIVDGENNVLWIPNDNNLSDTNLIPFDTNRVLSFTKSTIIPTFFSSEVSPPFFSQIYNTTFSLKTNSSFLYTQTNTFFSLKENLLSPILQSDSSSEYLSSVETSLFTLSTTIQYNLEYNTYLSFPNQQIEYIETEYNKYTSVTYNATSEIPTIFQSNLKGSFIFGPSPTSISTTFSLG